MDLLLLFAPYQQYMEGVGMDALPNFRFCYHFPVQQTNFGIGLRFKYVVHLFGLATNTLNTRKHKINYYLVLCFS